MTTGTSVFQRRPHAYDRMQPAYDRMQAACVPSVAPALRKPEYSFVQFSMFNFPRLLLILLLLLLLLLPIGC